MFNTRTIAKRQRTSDRLTPEGKILREIRRCSKRFILRRLFSKLPTLLTCSIEESGAFSLRHALPLTSLTSSSSVLLIRSWGRRSMCWARCRWGTNTLIPYSWHLLAKIIVHAR